MWPQHPKFIVVLMWILIGFVLKKIQITEEFDDIGAIDYQEPRLCHSPQIWSFSNMIIEYINFLCYREVTIFSSLKEPNTVGFFRYFLTKLFLTYDCKIMNDLIILASNSHGLLMDYTKHFCLEARMKYMRCARMDQIQDMWLFKMKLCLRYTYSLFEIIHVFKKSQTIL